MKLNEAIKKSLAAPYPTANELISSAGRRKSKFKRLVVFAAAAMALLGVSVSAAAALSGFERAFDVTLDVGSVEVISESTGDAEFDVEVTEVWFDEHNVHLGGIVTTPEPLNTDGRYELIMYYSVDGGKEFSTGAKIYPTGECASAFVLSSWQSQNEDIGVSGNTAEFALRFERICDWSRKLCESHIDDFTAYFGEVALTIRANSAEKSPRRGTADGIDATLNEFTLELVGNLGEYHAIFVKMSDGTLIGHEQGDVSRESSAQDGLLLTFAEPLDIANVESVMIVDEWYISPTGDEVIDCRVEIGLE